MIRFIIRREQVCIGLHKIYCDSAGIKRERYVAISNQVIVEVTASDKQGLPYPSATSPKSSTPSVAKLLKTSGQKMLQSRSPCNQSVPTESRHWKQKQEIVIGTRSWQNQRTVTGTTNFFQVGLRQHATKKQTKQCAQYYHRQTSTPSSEQPLRWKTHTKAQLQRGHHTVNVSNNTSTSVAPFFHALTAEPPLHKEHRF